MSRFQGKTVWVTGAGRGIGEHIATAFAHEGARVIGFDIDFPAPEYPFYTQVLDVSDPDAVTRICTPLLATSGPDILVNGAGILRLGPTEALSWQDWQQSMNVNAGGAFNLLRVTIPYFQQQRAGNIVSIVSNAAHVPRVGMAVYCASKAAMRSLCLSAGLELAPLGIRCNLVSPGSTQTPMLQSMLADNSARQRTIDGLPGQFKLGIPLGKIARPADIAATVLFLASDEAGHITLQDIVIDGGATLGA